MVNPVRLQFMDTAGLGGEQRRIASAPSLYEVPAAVTDQVLRDPHAHPAGLPCAAKKAKTTSNRSLSNRFFSLSRTIFHLSRQTPAGAGYPM